MNGGKHGVRHGAASGACRKGRASAPDPATHPDPNAGEAHGPTPGHVRRRSGIGPARRVAACGMSGCLGLLAWAGPAAAQQDPNPLLTLNFSSEVSASDNYSLSPTSPGDSTFLDNNLDLSYRSETQTQSLGFTGGATLRYADLPAQAENDGLDLDDPRLRFDYTLTGAEARLTARASYNRTDIAFSDPLTGSDNEIDPITGQDLLQNAGTREAYAAAVSMETGLSSPLGFTLALSTRGRNFTDTDDPSYYDNRTDGVTAGMRMTLSPVTVLNFNGGYSQYTADDAEETDRRTTYVSAGIGQSFSSVLTANASLGYRHIETDETTTLGLRETQLDEGMTAALGLTRELTNGTIGLTYSHDITTEGGRNSLSLSRSLALPDGSFSASVGVTKGDGSNPGAIGSLNYQRNLTSGGISANLSRTIGSNFDDEQETRTRAGIDWRWNLTPWTDANLGVSYIDLSNETDGDLRRAQFSASLSHDLTADWQVAGGYEYQELTDDPDDKATENRVFLRLQRQFQFRP